METMKTLSVRLPRIITQTPLRIYAVSITSALIWCYVLGIIDNESDSTQTFLVRHFDLYGFLWYGVPVAVCILWLVGSAARRGHNLNKALLWTIPLGCVAGTAIALIVFAIVFGFMKLTGIA